MSQIIAESVLKKTLHERLAAETHPAAGEVLQVAVNREEFLKLQRTTGIPVISQRGEQNFIPE
jgi:hypothetical protein